MFPMNFHHGSQLCCFLGPTLNAQSTKRAPMSASGGTDQKWLKLCLSNPSLDGCLVRHEHVVSSGEVAHPGRVIPFCTPLHAWGSQLLQQGILGKHPAFIWHGINMIWKGNIQQEISIQVGQLVWQRVFHLATLYMENAELFALSPTLCNLWVMSQRGTKVHPFIAVCLLLLNTTLAPGGSDVSRLVRVVMSGEMELPPGPDVAAAPASASLSRELFSTPLDVCTPMFRRVHVSLTEHEHDDHALADAENMRSQEEVMPPSVVGREPSRTNKKREPPRTNKRKLATTNTVTESAHEHHMVSASRARDEWGRQMDELIETLNAVRSARATASAKTSSRSRNLAKCMRLATRLCAPALWRGLRFNLQLLLDAMDVGPYLVSLFTHDKVLRSEPLVLLCLCLLHASRYSPVVSTAVAYTLTCFTEGLCVARPAHTTYPPYIAQLLLAVVRSPVVSSTHHTDIPPWWNSAKEECISASWCFQVDTTGMIQGARAWWRDTELSDVDVLGGAPDLVRNLVHHLQSPTEWWTPWVCWNGEEAPIELPPLRAWSAHKAVRAMLVASSARVPFVLGISCDDKCLQPVLNTAWAFVRRHWARRDVSTSCRAGWMWLPAMYSCALRWSRASDRATWLAVTYGGAHSPRTEWAPPVMASQLSCRTCPVQRRSFTGRADVEARKPEIEQNKCAPTAHRPDAMHRHMRGTVMSVVAVRKVRHVRGGFRTDC